MRQAVLSFLIWSACGGLAALGAWAASALLRRLHTPARLLCWLWAAVGLRFLLPWGIPVTLPRPQNSQLAEAADTVQALAVSPAPAVVPAVTATAQNAAPWYAGLTVWHLLAAAWAVGVAVLLVRAALAYRALRRRVALACKTPDGCYTGACVPAPFTLGLFRPRVYLPAGLADGVRASVLLHERTHIRRRDPLTKAVFYLACCLHWFNPLAWLAFRCFEGEMEAACDEAAVQGRPAAERNAYCEALLQFALHGRSMPGCLAFGQGSVKARIVHLLRYRRLGTGALLACALAVAVCTTACMMRPTVAERTPAVQTSADTQTVAAVPAPTATPEAAQPATVAQTALSGTLLDRAGSMAMPLKSYKYISRLYTQEGGHRGVDFTTDEGTEVYAMEDGIVTAADYHYSWGNYVQLYHGIDADGLQWNTLYAHLSGLAVQAGQSVTRGQLIGYTGATGVATGQMLHLELTLNGQTVDPLYFIEGENGELLTPELAAELVQSAQSNAPTGTTAEVLAQLTGTIQALCTNGSDYRQALQAALDTGNTAGAEAALRGLDDTASTLSSVFLQVEQALFNYDLGSATPSDEEAQAAADARAALDEAAQELNDYLTLIQQAEAALPADALPTATSAQQRVDDAAAALDAYLQGAEG